MMEKKIDIYDRVFRFVSRVLKMDQILSGTRSVDRNTMNQLVAAASSIGSNLEEARAGQSRADFHAKLRIALKEARESQYWLRLISGSGAIPSTKIDPLVRESGEIVGILTAIAKKTNPRNLSPPSNS
jgi:four helix bundle protein